MKSYALQVVDEVSQLSREHFDFIVKHWLERDRIGALAFCGDRFQMAGFGDERPWHGNLWKQVCYRVDLHQGYRCKDEKHNEALSILRTAQPNEKQMHYWRQKRNRAWEGEEPTVNDIGRILKRHPDTVFLCNTRLGAAKINSLALEAKHPKKVPLIILPGDVESNPANYIRGKLKDVKELKPMDFHFFKKGQPVYLTRNVRKDIDFVNGMKATVESSAFKRTHYLLPACLRLWFVCLPAVEYG